MDMFQVFPRQACAESWPSISALNGHVTQPPGRFIAYRYDGVHKPATTQVSLSGWENVGASLKCKVFLGCQITDLHAKMSNLHVGKDIFLLHDTSFLFADEREKMIIDIRKKSKKGPWCKFLRLTLSFDIRQLGYIFMLL